MGAQSKEKEAVSPWGGREAGGGDRVPAAPTVAVDRRGPGKGLPGPLLSSLGASKAGFTGGGQRPGHPASWRPWRPGGAVSDPLSPESEGTGTCRRQGMDAGSLATDGNNGQRAVRRSSEI